MLHKRPPHLFGFYLGQTKAEIAAAFPKVHDTSAALVYDKAESLFVDRVGDVWR